jgi:hypothetical protein
VTITIASSSRELLHRGGPSAVTGSSISASGTSGQARHGAGSSAASTSQTWWCVHDTGESTTPAAPTMINAESQSPSRPRRAARRRAIAAIAPPMTRTASVRIVAGTSKRISAPFRDWLPTEVM